MACAAWVREDASLFPQVRVHPEKGRFRSPAGILHRALLTYENRPCIGIPVLGPTDPTCGAIRLTLPVPPTDVSSLTNGVGGQLLGDARRWRHQATLATADISEDSTHIVGRSSGPPVLAKGAPMEVAASVCPVSPVPMLTPHPRISALPIKLKDAHLKSLIEATGSTATDETSRVSVCSATSPSSHPGAKLASGCWLLGGYHWLTYHQIGVLSRAAALAFLEMTPSLPE